MSKDPTIDPAHVLSRRQWLGRVGFGGMVLLTGCKSLPQGAGNVDSRRFVFHKGAMGTVFTITMYARDESAAQQAADAAFRRIVELNDMMTDYDRDSELMRFCLAPYGQPVRLSDDLFNVLAKAQWLANKTQGAFDITLGPLIRLWRRARRQRELPPPEYIAAARLSSGYQNLQLDARQRTGTLLKPHMALDLGGIAKGYAAQSGLAVLRKFGFREAMVAASGDLAIGEPPPDRDGWNIGIDSIDAVEGRHSRIVSVKNCGLSTSGDTEQYAEIEGRRYSHIVDPRTGLGLLERIGVTVIAENAIDSDSFGTAVSVLGAEQGMRFIEEETRTAALIVVLKDGKMQQIESRRFKKLKAVRS